MRAAVLLLNAALLFAQPEPATIHGVVREALTGAPMSGITVKAGRVSTVTSPAGAYTLRGIPPGDTQIEISGEMVNRPQPRKVSLRAGQDLSVDLTAQALGRISGAVTDSDGQPITDAMVSAVTREYSLGALRYVLWYSALTNSRGEFGTSGTAAPLMIARGNDTPLREMAASALERALSIRSGTAMPFVPARGIAIESGRGYLLLVSKGRAVLAKDGEIEEDPANRKPIPHVTWYIGARAPDAALPLTLAPAERREGMNIRTATGPGYCIHGTVRAGAVPGGSLQVVFGEAPMASQGILGRSSFEKKLADDPALETTLHICNLSPGDYRITSMLLAKPDTFPSEFRTQVVSIVDRDVKVVMDGRPKAELAGEIVLEGDPLPDPVILRVSPMNHLVLAPETVTAKASVPGRFSFDDLVADEYDLLVKEIPAGIYLKDVTSDGRSVLHQPLIPGAIGELRVILGRDGARISAQAEPDSWVVAMPATPSSPIAAADTMVWGRADATGMWTSPLLAPGKYLVLAGSAPVDRSMEAVERVFQSRNKASEVELAPGGTGVVKLK
jgi:hypothetical protein